MCVLGVWEDHSRWKKGSTVNPSPLCYVADAGCVSSHLVGTLQKASGFRGSGNNCPAATERRRLRDSGFKLPLGTVI